jgi:sugar/nucleoside kinase (ribokinase family)
MNEHEELIMNRVYGFGSAAVDFRISVADMGAGYLDKVLAQKTQIFGGGAMANCLTQVARLGLHATWLGKTGCDWIGDRILDQLQQEGIDCMQVIRDETLCSPFNLAVYANNYSRRIGGFLLPNSLAALSDADLDNWSSDMKPGDWVVVEIGEIPVDYLLVFCRLIKKHGASLVIDVDLDPYRQCLAEHQQIDAIFSLADILIPNQSAIMSLYPDLPAKEMVQMLAERYHVISILTAGADGAYYCAPADQARHLPAEPVSIVDTVGAGDAFHGGLVYALACGWSLANAVALGIKCGSRNCTRFGARSGMPYAAELGLINSKKDTDK